MADAVPDLTGLLRSDREEGSPTPATACLFTAVTSGVLAVSRALDGHAGAALCWTALLVFQMVFFRWAASHPFSTDLDGRGLTIRRPGRTRRNAWGDATALHPGRRWDAARSGGAQPSGAVTRAAGHAPPVGSRPAGLAGLERGTWRTVGWFVTGMVVVQLVSRAPSVLPHDGLGTAAQVVLLVLGFVCFGVAGLKAFLRHSARQSGSSRPQEPQQ
ncbi:hypothetical protein [Quadrisphaera setariae]|uniref:Uncharacterized protein n=1 Tax=Quadrisphaera setariae TaxID=2593304 RepID=A0A5C8ZHX5_9ACTN|nr:hypothetical protein [Quadrisphaera setariae]TXR56778.1 hypothetical protein FMM08_08590 [Quadrisphaera setariae]